MNKEIKVLLNSLQNIVETIDIRPRSDNFTNINDSDIKLLLDYITNLQEENKKLNERLQIAQNAYLLLTNRIDIATEYIEKHRKVYKLGVNQETDEFDYISTSPQTLLNILRGDK